MKIIMSIGKSMAILIVRVHVNMKSLFHILFNPVNLKYFKNFPSRRGEGGKTGLWGAMNPAPTLATALGNLHRI